MYGRGRSDSGSGMEQMRMKQKKLSELAVRGLLAAVLILAGILCVYPFLYVFSMSVSAPEHVLRKDVTFLPRGLSLEGYGLVFENPTVWRSYRNTILYTVFGTALNMVLTVLAAYPLSREKFVLRRPVSILITITMYVSGGMIPFFIVVTNLGLYNTPLSVILPFAVSAWNIIIARSFYEEIPEALAEAAQMDGASHLTVLVKIMLPLSKPILSVLLLYYAVGHWNNYFWPMVLVPNPQYQPLQVFLRSLLILKQDVGGASAQIGISRTAQMEQLKYAAIIVSVLPILFIYPFIQKYFVKGVSVGAIKE